MIVQLFLLIVVRDVGFKGPLDESGPDGVLLELVLCLVDKPGLKDKVKSQIKLHHLGKKLNLSSTL